MMHRIQLTIFSVLFLAVFALNAFIICNAWLGAVLLFLFLAVFGWELGGVITNGEKAVLRWWIGVWILISILLVTLSIFYYAWKITEELSVVIILICVPVILWASRRFSHKTFFAHAHDLWRTKKHKIPQVVLIGSSLAVLALCVMLLSVAQNPITDSVRSVWERMPQAVFICFSAACALIFALLMRGRERALSLGLVCALVFAFISVVAIAFPIGYGFDSFIHKATETHIAQFGTISPKPFYYIGQYSLVLLAQQAFKIPIDTADTSLILILTSLLLPPAWYYAAAHIARKRSVAMATMTGIFLIPLSSFIVTTPQALANLWTLLLIFASVPYLLEKEHPRLTILLIACAATFFIHPLSGIPAFLYFAFLATDPSRLNSRTKKINATARVALIVVACAALPASFIAQSVISGQKIFFNWSALNPLALINSISFGALLENRFSPILDLVYSLGNITTILFCAIAIAAWIGYRRDLSGRFRALLLTSVALLINYFLISSALQFTFLIDYERANYASRLIPLIVYFLSPLAVLGLAHFFTNLKNKPFALRAFCFSLLVALAASGFYLAYPRRDAYETSRGFNVGNADINAVQLIEQWAGAEPYIVLANQSVSAAAIQELGFRYYDGLFFYPIPTGEKLYEKFLLMNESPSRETASQASALFKEEKIKIVFFVVNNYWYRAARIMETAKTNADSWKTVGELGQVVVFRYDLKHF